MHGMILLMVLALASPAPVFVLGDDAPYSSSYVDSSREVPPVLSNAVRLATHFADLTGTGLGSGQQGLRVDMEAAHREAMEAEVLHGEGKVVLPEGICFVDDLESYAGASKRWEDVTGGSSTTLCGSASGERALCFGGDAFVAAEEERSVVALREATTHAVEATAPGTRIRFYIAIARPHAYDDNDDDDDENESGEEGESRVALEYKAAGGAWTPLRSFGSGDYCQGQAGGGEGDGAGAAVRGEKVFSFCEVEVALPPGARSRATKFRWRQAKVGAGAGEEERGGAGLDRIRPSAVEERGRTPSFPSWAIDDVEVSSEGAVEGRPDSSLSSLDTQAEVQVHLILRPPERTAGGGAGSGHGGAHDADRALHGRLATVLVFFSQEVESLQAADFEVSGGGRAISVIRVPGAAGVSGQPTPWGKGGSLYTLTLLRGSGREPMRLWLPGKKCLEKGKRRRRNAESNTLEVPPLGVGGVSDDGP